MTFRLANTSLNTVSYSSLYMLYGLSDEMWIVGNVVYYGSGILSMSNVGGCVDVRDVRYWMCWMLGLWDIGRYGMFGMCECSRCGMFGMWDVWDVGCWRCRMLGMWDVRDVGCGIWDICWDVEYWFAKDLVVRNNSWSNSLSWKILLIFLNVVPTLLLTASFNCLFDLPLV